MGNAIFGDIFKLSKSLIVVVFDEKWIVAKSIAPSFFLDNDPFTNACDTFDQTFGFCQSEAALKIGRTFVLFFRFVIPPIIFVGFPYQWRHRLHSVVN